MKKPSRTKSIVIILSVLVAVIVVIFLIRAFFFTAVRSSSFYAVFLDNGQVYFGKVSKQTEQEIVLDHVFYLKASAEFDTTGDSSLPDANLSLVKLGKEIYKPHDRMIINRTHVLFLEEMLPGSEVMNAILEYEKADN